MVRSSSFWSHVTTAGIAASPDRSVTLTKADSIDSVLAAHDRRCERSRSVMDALARPRSSHGHADILREQLLAGRSD